MNQVPPNEPEVRDYYLDLGLPRDATLEEIKRAFHKQAKIHHPDKKTPGIQIDAHEFRKASSGFSTVFLFNWIQHH
jgi:curved DNA-binding protein CbpA